MIQLYATDTIHKVDTHTMDSYSATEKKKLLKPPTIWMDFKGTMLSEKC